MADIEVKIQLQDTVEDNIRVIESPNDVNNASIQKVETAFNRLSVLNDGMNLKSWATGSLSLADGVVGGSETSLVEQYGYEGYVFGAVPESKEFPVTIEITGRDIDNIIVYGDKEANQFPTKAYRDSNPNDIIYNNSVDWDISFNDQANTHTITFLEWNRANYNACISHISVKSLSLILGKKWIKNVESLSQSTDRPNEIFYGVLPNSGHLSLVDIDGSLKNYAEEGHFDNANLSIGIFANGKEVKRHISADSNYDNVARTLDVVLGDSLSDWEQLQYKGYAYPKESENAYNMLLDVLVSIGYTQSQVDKMLSTEIVYGVDNQVGSVKQYLQEIPIPYPYLPSASVRETIDKFCVLAQLQVYKTDRNEIKFVSARPRATTIETTNVITIGESRMFENFTKSILLKNKYDNIELLDKKVNDIIEYDSHIIDKKISEFPDLQTNSSNTSSGKYKSYGSSYYRTNTGLWEIRGGFTKTYLENKYTSGSFNIKDTSDDGLITILKAFGSSGEDTKFSVKYKQKRKYEFNAFSSVNIGEVNQNFSFDFSNFDWSDAYISNSSGNIPLEFTTENEDFNVNVDTSVSLSNSNNITVNYNENTKEYTVSYNLLALANVCSGSGFSEYTNPNNVTGVALAEGITYYQYEPTEIEISVYGNKRVISFEDLITGNISSNNLISLDIQNNELIQEKSGIFTSYSDNFLVIIDGDNVIVTARHIIPEDVELTLTGMYKDGSPYGSYVYENVTFNANTKTMTYQIPDVVEIGVSEVVNLDTGDEMGDWTIGTKMSDIIKINIKEDYVTGISNATLSVPCLDYYNENGEKVKDWSKGEMLEVHDIIRVQGDKTLWRITGRNFRKQGIPMLDLELQQIKE